MATKGSEEKEIEKPKQRYELVEVPTQTAIVVRDTETDTVFQQEQILQEILNRLDKIDKNTG